MASVHTWPDSIPITCEGEGKKSSIFLAIHVDPQYKDRSLDLGTPVLEFVQVLFFQWPVGVRFMV